MHVFAILRAVEEPVGWVTLVALSVAQVGIRGQATEIGGRCGDLTKTVCWRTRRGKVCA